MRLRYNTFMTIIYHITTRETWQQAQPTGTYLTDSLSIEGFIHCSTRDQAAGSGNRHFQGRTGLVLLCIDPAKVDSPIRYENLVGGQDLFPHIYGPLPCAAVLDVLPFETGADGTFYFPGDETR